MCEANTENGLTENFKYQELLINEERYLVGVCKKIEIRTIVVTNLVEFYNENLCKEDIIERCENLNPLSDDFNFEEIVDDLLLNISKYVISSSLDNIQLQNKIDGGCFKFCINLSKCSPEYIYSFFMENFYFSFFELHNRYTCLLDIIKKKDNEIAEYKAQGVELLKKSMISEPFDESQFQTRLMNKRPMNKLSVFLEVTKFYNSVKNLHHNNIGMEDKVMKSEPQSDKSPCDKSLKRPSSSDIRCAVAPKLSNKTKINKQSLKFECL